MNSQTFSRSFLQGLQEQCRQQRLDQHLQQFIQNIKNEAAVGKTSYIFNLNESGYIRNSWEQGGKPLIPTNDDFISAFKRRFPDCDVYYQEMWIDVDSNNKVLKKGIVIDWS